MLEWLLKVRHVQHLVGGACKYYLPASVSFLKSEEVFWIPNAAPVEILQVWEDDLVPQIKYGYGFAVAAHQVLVSRGGVVQVDLSDGETTERVSLTYGHVLSIPPCIWYSFFTKASGKIRKDAARLQTFTNADLSRDGWFCRMDAHTYASVRQNMRR